MSDTTQHSTLLAWDSEQFGFNVAKILPASLDKNALAECLNELKKQQVKLVYWVIDQQDALANLAARECGGLLVDHKMTYATKLTKTYNKDAIESYPQTLPNHELLQLAYLSGKYSRFRADNHITEQQFQKIYGAWITNSTLRHNAQDVLVVKEDGKIVGMITLGEKNSRGDIGLLAVAENAHGKGYGTLLVNSALSYFHEKNYPIAQVVTQQTNIPACKLYEKCGFHIDKIEHFYHFWL